MYCTRCGAWNAQGAAFCWKCGASLAPAAPSPPPAPAAPGAPSESPAAGAPPSPPPPAGYGQPPVQPPAWPQTPYATYPPPAAPVYGPRWFYLSASGLALGISITAAVAAVLYGIAAGLGLAGAATDDWDALEISGAFIGLGSLAAIAVGILLIIWTRRITGNLLPFQPALELGTGWAVGSWFVPIINYWFPLRIWNQAWRATDPAIAPPIGWQWKGRPVPAVHVLSWVAYHVGSWVAIIGIPTEDDTNAAIGYAGFAGGTLVAMGMVFLILVVRNLTARQDEYARRYLPGLGAPGAVPQGPVFRGG
ncbi:DUF4328 domain-containing protein [Tepidiforma sp.]|uniref:DUF4328 domain-containing protein n=1 Tax=Tepidiforma sp. TaxID=2682230 RepID=UPI002633FED4|nr:DUF4328 domain-containing protein [Tepidiforma sp.]MCX7618159.1 DUF4328 domain-containing protein [Tepidiforma sp.]